ncbi:MAG: DUF4402 domain-containing protein [Gemmatimonadota bacterium]|nr:DUF4402 domain-containing protein [Gemmatimonadota bacterium]
MNHSTLAARTAGPLPRLRLILFVLLMLAGTAVRGQSFTVSSIQPVNGSIGTVTSDASGTTTYTISAATGATTRKSGSGLPVNATGTRALVTIGCTGNGNSCGGANGSTVSATVKLTPAGTPSGRALALTNFNAAPGDVAPSATQGSGASFQFTVTGNFRNGATHNFYIGADFPIASTGTTGTASSDYLITVSGAGNPSGSTATGSFAANVRRPISISRASHLAFGTVVRPTTGSNTIAIDATSGTRSMAGGGNAALRSSTTSRAQFTVTGESGQAFDITALPATVTMTSPGGGSIPVTLSRTHTNPVSISGGSTSAAGTVTIGVGGSFTITSTTPTGAYSATFPITVTYN